MNKRKIITIIIALICAIVVMFAVIWQILIHSTNSTIKSQPTIEGKSQEELKKEFNNSFSNVVNYNGYDTNNIQKLDDSKELVYCAYQLEENKENRYEVNLNIPVININNDVAYNMNVATQKIFADKATEVLNKTDDTITIYSIEYTGYINGNILSLIIKSTLKEGNHAQRVIVQTYNYDLEAEQEISVYDAIMISGKTEGEVTTKIQEQIANAIKQANSIQISGYSTYTRDLENEIYELDNSSQFFFGEDGKLYIVYAYGNNHYTSEMDIIEI